MSGIQQTTDEIIEKCEKWCRLAILVNNPVKDALLAILHNTVLDPSINGLPDEPTLLYKHMVTNEKKLRNNKLLKQDQLDLLLPHNWKVYSKSFDVTLIRFLIHTFSKIVNEDGDWKKPRHDDHSIAAAVFRAADIRNRVFHYKDPNALGNVEFEKMWREIEDILADLRYVGDISEFRENTLDPVLARKLKQIHVNNMAEDFENILVAYKDKCKNENKDEWKTFIQRRYKNLSTNNIVTDIDAILRDHDSVMVSGPAGLGKTFSAKNLRYSWASDELLEGKNLFYIDSKKVCRDKVKGYRAPFHLSELGNMLMNKPDDYLESFNCVTKTIDNLLILIDGVDELSIDYDKLNLNYLKDLKVKIENNEEITSIQTILGIYFGIFFPGSKIIAFGRNNEIDRLKKIDDKLGQSTFFKKPTRAVLELQPLEEEDVKELISLVNCGKKSCGCEKCTKTYNSVKDVEFRNIPSHLMAMIKIFKYLPNPKFGRITKTKIFIIEIFNLLYKHTQTVSLIEDVTTFETLLKCYDKEFRECIQNIAKMSFFSLLYRNVTIEVKANDKNDVEYFEYKQTVKGRDICVQIKRNILEQLDFFYIRDLKFRNFILEPYHLTNMEFLASCHIYSTPDERDLLLELNEDRQTVILPYVAGLYSNDDFTQDFVCEVFPNTSNRDVETYLSWLFSVEDVRNDLPFDWSRWYGLKENGQLIPSFDLLHEINEENDVFKEKLKEVKTLVCYCDGSLNRYLDNSDVEKFKHELLTKKFTDKVKFFISEFDKYQIIVNTHNIAIRNKEGFNLLFNNNDKIEFRINHLYFVYNTPHTHVKKHLKCNALTIGSGCDSRTIDFLLNTTSLSTVTTSSRIPTIKYKRVAINYISQFNDQQIEKLFTLGLSDVVDSISLCSTFFNDGQIAILKGLERKANKKINIELEYVKFNDMFGLPNLGNRHVSLCRVDNVTDNELIELKKHIPTGYANKLTNYIKLYKIISLEVPFVRKENSPRDVEHSMYLHLCDVNFAQVSPDIFAEFFSMVPSLSFEDHVRYIPSSLWARLSQTENGRLNEMRIWDPTERNLEYFLKLKINILQLIYYDKSDLKQLLTHIVNNTNIELNKKEIKVFVVKVDKYDWDDYKEITLFSETIEEYRNNHSSYDKLLDNTRKGRLDKQWWLCCEISLSAEKNTDDALQGFSGDNKRCNEETVDKVEQKTDDAEIEDNCRKCCCLF